MKTRILLATVVTVVVVSLTYLVFLFVLGSDRLPGLDVALMIAVVCFVLFLCSALIANMVKTSRWFG